VAARYVMEAVRLGAGVPLRDAQTIEAALFGVVAG
jgi:hypothetical protein